MTAAEALNHRWLGRASNVSTKNLFAVSTNATSAMDDFHANEHHVRGMICDSLVSEGLSEEPSRSTGSMKR